MNAAKRGKRTLAVDGMRPALRNGVTWFLRCWAQPKLQCVCVGVGVRACLYVCMCMHADVNVCVCFRWFKRVKETVMSR